MLSGVKRAPFGGCAALDTASAPCVARAFVAGDPDHASAFLVHPALSLAFLVNRSNLLHVLKFARPEATAASALRTDAARVLDRRDYFVSVGYKNAIPVVSPG